jgi:hypothetical protein
MRRLSWAIFLAVPAIGFADPPGESAVSDGRVWHPNWKPQPVPPTWPPVDPSRPEPKSPRDPSEPIDPLARASEAGTQPAETFNPNMFGDIFGNRNQTIAVMRQRVFRTLMTDAAGGAISFAGAFDTTTLAPAAGRFIVLSDNGRMSGPFRTNFMTTAPLDAGTGNFGLVENSVVSKQLQAMNPGANVAYLPDQGTALRQTRGTRPNLTPSFLIEQGYLITAPVVADVVLPSAGGVVGRTKIADDNYPLPADRLILDFDQFGGAAVTPRGYNVSRFSVGGEVTAFGGAASAELRLPFASTLDPVIVAGGHGNRELVIGDVNLTLKALFMNTDGVVAAGGVGIAFPTAPDTLLQDTSGFNMLRLRNQSYIVTPFIGIALAPPADWFAQFWVECSFDTTGNEVLAPPLGFGEMQGIGRVYDPALLQTDVQIGYWVYRDMMNGVAPFAELHWNQSLGARGDFAANGVILRGADTLSELNVTLGVAALIGPNLFVNLGFAFPLRQAPDRSFDYQVGLRASYYFGSFGRR